MNIGGLPPLLLSPAGNVPSSDRKRAKSASAARAVPTQQSSAVQTVQRILGQAVAASLPENFDVSVEVGAEEASGRVFARVIDRSSGRVIHQFPPDELLALFARTREMLGPLYDEKA